MFRRRNLAAIGLSFASVGVAASMMWPTASAFADTTATTSIPNGASIASLQQKGEAAIDQRLANISKMQGVVSSAKNMTAGDRSALTSLLAGDQSALSALRVKIAADTDRATLKTDLISIVHDYRIFALVDPKVDLTRAADGVTVTGTKQADIVAKLDGVVAGLKAAGKDTSAIETQLRLAHTESQAALSSAAGQADAVQALQATDFPSNQGQRDAVRTAVKMAASHAKNANQALKSARTAIKSLRVAKP